MSFPKFQRTAVTEAGAVIPGATVTVRVQATGLLAGIFSDRAGTVTKDNPFNTGDDGLVEFYALNGEYRIEVTGGSGSIEWGYAPLVGAAALLDTGTESGEIPTTDDLESGAFTAVGTAATKDVQTNPSDATADSVLLVGAQPEALGDRVVSELNAAAYNAVAQGLTTGGNVVESGSNSNGTFIKYADGAMICLRADSTNTSLSVTNSSNGVFYNDVSFTYPAAFVGDRPSVSHSIVAAGVVTWAMPSGSGSLTTCTLRLITGLSVATTDYRAGYIAIGRWKA